MFDIKQTDVTGTTNKLLYNILEELKRLNTAEPVRPSREGVETAQKPKPPKGVISCKKCPAIFTNRGEFFAHMKEHKKKGE